MTVAAVVLAAGRGTRLGHELRKSYVEVGGKPLLLYSLETLSAVPEIDRLVPVLGDGDAEAWSALQPTVAALPKVTAPVVGGAERQDSVRAGVAALPAEVEWVAVHDAARPFVRPEAVSRVIEAARSEGAAILAAPVRDTIKHVEHGRVVSTPDREACWAAQTPQVFRVELLREALAKAEAAGRRATDDAQLVEWLGATVAVVEGDADNVKVTYSVDLAAAEQRIAAWRKAEA
jgi:2-C-methyl-D-erythritol 4-phosphate cytidylyltransferase